jgi:transcriptional regulator with XRE-family HTH domain
MQPTPFATWLTAQMKARGLSESDLADALKISPATIRNWLSLKRMGPDAVHCQQLAELFGIPLN